MRVSRNLYFRWKSPWMLSSERFFASFLPRQSWSCAHSTVSAPFPAVRVIAYVWKHDVEVVDTEQITQKSRCLSTGFCVSTNSRYFCLTPYRWIPKIKICFVSLLPPLWTKTFCGASTRTKMGIMGYGYPMQRKWVGFIDTSCRD